MPLGSRSHARNTSTLALVIAGLLAAGLWIQATMNRADGPRVLGVTVWTGSQTFPSGFTIVAGQTVELNPNANTTVALGGNLLIQGTLRSRPAPGVTHTIRFTGIDESSFVGGGDVPISSDKGVWVTGAGNLDLSGTPKLAWTRATGTLTTGATTASLHAVPTGWSLGDEVLITPTEAPTVSDFAKHHETRTITSVNGSTIGFAPLTHDHPLVTVKPGVSYGAEIVNLTRNVRIEGQDPTHRTHIWMKSSVPQTIRYTAVRYVGPQKGSPADTVLGRYGLHFHRMADAARGSLVEGVVVRQTGGVAFAVHRSHGVTLRNTVAFDVQDVAYWYDASATEAPNDALYEGALAAYVKPTPKQYPAYRLTAFWLGWGNGNACVRCVAVGVLGGKNASGFGWPEGEVGIWRFEDSLAHNNSRNGIFVWQNASGGHVVTRFTAYHNGYAGIEHGAYTNEYHYLDNVLYGNMTAAVILHAESQANPPPTSFQRPYVDGAGITANAVMLAKPTNVDQPPSVWCEATVLGITGPIYLIAYTGPDSTIEERLDTTGMCSDVPAPTPGTGQPRAKKL